METNHIQPKYRENRDRLEQSNLSAYQFLVNLEQHAPSLWLSTSVNAHLYAGRRFLCYIKFTRDSGIILSPHYNRNIWTGTEYRSYLLFPQSVRTIIDQYPDSQQWARPTGKEGFSISNRAPATFFDQLLQRIIDISNSGA